MKNAQIRNQVRGLRLTGLTYQEINAALKTTYAKSTLSSWCHNLTLSAEVMREIANRNTVNLAKGRAASLNRKRLQKKDEKDRAQAECQNLSKVFVHDKRVQKIALAMLYLAEGSKTHRASIMFGNSSRRIVELFLNLMRKCFKIEEKKFRVTVQCRADQNIENLQKYWSQVTNIPLSQFYKAQIDKRTLNRPTRKKDYRGVCRIDYFSSNIDYELKYIADNIGGP